MKMCKRAVAFAIRHNINLGVKDFGHGRQYYIRNSIGIVAVSIRGNGTSAINMMKRYLGKN